jgi:hypothetical protein
MSVKNFKFVSPGVFINEIDNSFFPEDAENIGPVVIGRSERGLAMQPIKVGSYSDYVTTFGNTVPGMGGGDVARDGNFQSPMYGTYAAKAFLRANVAPLTYIRLLGQQSSNASGDAGQAGWKTDGTPTSAVATNGGAFGLFVFESGSSLSATMGQGHLGAIWYVMNGGADGTSKGEIYLSGTIYPGKDAARADLVQGCGVPIASDANGLFAVTISGSKQMETVKFNFDDGSENFIRKRFNTNPQLANKSASLYYPSSLKKDYWLGESYEQFLRVAGKHTGQLVGVLMPLGVGGIGAADTSYNPAKMKGQASREAVAGWFIGQDTGNSGQYEPQNAQKLFRLVGRGHGEWLSNNAKVSIERIRASTSKNSEYGSFSVVIRELHDTDQKVVILERFDNCNLNPKSPNFVGRKIGTQYNKWDATNKRLRSYGDYPNLSKYVYVDLNADVAAGAMPSNTLLPFGYYGPPTPITQPFSGSDFGGTAAMGVSAFMLGGVQLLADKINTTSLAKQTGGPLVSGALGAPAAGDLTTNCMTGSFVFPSASLRVSASDGGLKDPTNAYFGFSSARTSTSTRASQGLQDYAKLWYSGIADDPTNGAYATNGVAAWSHIFSMDDITSYYGYQSGSRKLGDSKSSSSYTDLLNAGYDRFTANFWGGFDGFDITVPDPLANSLMTDGTSTEDNSYVYHTYRRAIDTITDPEYADMNILTVPGLTLPALTGHAIDVCEERGDALALIDLPDVYIPSHESYKSDVTETRGTTPLGAARSLSDRRIDSSYGATFYPWVQTRDEETGQLLWIPPSVAMMGVLASSEAKSDVWFAPAGFNRGGLTDGAAGIPITGITERLTSKDRDTLYDYNINPIASFPSTGIVLFGQKTLQERRSALDRINVRRLVIYMKKQISILSTQVLFEQNVQTTWNRFTGLIEPFLANVQTRFDITEYKLVLDETTTTPDLIDQNVLYAKIMIKPARAIEFIAIDFVIARTGASFND